MSIKKTTNINNDIEREEANSLLKLAMDDYIKYRNAEIERISKSSLTYALNTKKMEEERINKILKEQALSPRSKKERGPYISSLNTYVETLTPQKIERMSLFNSMKITENARRAHQVNINAQNRQIDKERKIKQDKINVIAQRKAKMERRKAALLRASKVKGTIQRPNRAVLNTIYENRPYSKTNI